MEGVKLQGQELGVFPRVVSSRRGHHVPPGKETKAAVGTGVRHSSQGPGASVALQKCVLETELEGAVSGVVLRPDNYHSLLAGLQPDSQEHAPRLGRKRRTGLSSK